MFVLSIKVGGDLPQNRSKGKAPYSEDELLVLLYEYEELREVANKAWVTVRLIDLWRAYSHLSKQRKEAVLLMGLFGFSSRTAGTILGVSHTAMVKRFLAGLDTMLRTLNGGK